MVTRDTRWPAGTPCWVDVSVDDVPKAIAFYQALFGWDIELGGPEVGGYSIAHQDGRIVAAISPKMAGPGAPTVWTTFLATDDADATAAKRSSDGYPDPSSTVTTKHPSFVLPSGAVFSSIRTSKPCRTFAIALCTAARVARDRLAK